MCECVVALLITVCGTDEVCFLYVGLRLYKEAKSVPCMIADVTPI